MSRCPQPSGPNSSASDSHLGKACTVRPVQDCDTESSRLQKISALRSQPLLHSRGSQWKSPAQRIRPDVDVDLAKVIQGSRSVELADNRVALDRICTVLTEYWRGTNMTRTDARDCPRSGVPSRSTNCHGLGTAPATPSGKPMDKH